MSDWKQANKPREIEEFLDSYLIRPMGFVVAAVLRRTPVTPNMVSAAAVVAAMACALAYFHRTPTGAWLGLLFMLLTSALDSADGQLARLTGRASETGRSVDGVCDNLSFGAIYIAIIVSYHQHGGRYTWVIILLAIAAGASHSVQSALADFQRLLFMFYRYGRGAPTREHPEILRGRLAATPSRFERVLLRLHLNYSIEQREFLPSSDRLLREHQRLTTEQPETAERFTELYGQSESKFVGWWALGATNVHKVGIVLTAFLPLYITEGPLNELGMVTYFIWDIALNIPLLVMIALQRRRDDRLLTELRRLAEELPS